MSYDVNIGMISENFTSNLRPFFDEFDVNIPSMHGQSGLIVSERIDEALGKIVMTPMILLDEYNPPNGWGSWVGALEFLMRIRDEARRVPDETVSVSA